MNSKYNYELIRDYLHGVVDQETAEKVRNLVRNDEVARNIAEGILRLEHEFKGNENEIEAYIEGLREKQLKLIAKRPSRVWLRLAAAILLVAVASALVWFLTRDTLNDELRQPYPLAVIDRGDSNANSGFEFYAQGEYRKAIESFDKVTGDVSVNFYNGLSHLYAGEYDQAVTLLGSLAESRYNQQALWFQSLALIKAGRNDEAKKNLEEISSNPANYKSDVAKKLLSSYEE